MAMKSPSATWKHHELYCSKTAKAAEQHEQLCKWERISGSLCNSQRAKHQAVLMEELTSQPAADLTENMMD